MTIGILLLIVGFFTCSTGVVLIYNARSDSQKNIVQKAVIEPIEKELVIEPIVQAKEKEPDNQSKITIFDSLISMATIDGVLTKNEISGLKAKARELGLNYSDFSVKIDEQILSKQNKRETKILDQDKEKGDDFEKYIVQKVSEKYFMVLEWAGDKYVNGIYAKTTTQPDLKMRFKLKDIEVDFAVECKYRSNFPENGVVWCSENQFKNYRDFANEMKMPVFLALGIAGSASQPEELFLVPLDEVETVLLSRSFLKNYKKWNFKDNDLFFNPQENRLN